MIPDQVTIYEVGPRDGLQNEPDPLPVEDRVKLVERLALSGLPYVEAGSFVRPDLVPQMAGSDDVMERVKRQERVRYPVLVPNETGLDRARAAGADAIAVFAAATETFSRKNLNCSIDESLNRYRPVVSRARDDGIWVRGYVSCVVDGPYEGAVEPSAVARVASALRGMGCDEISLGETIGTATPNRIRRVVEQVSSEVPVDALALHCHDTYGQAIANVHEALRAGITTFDASVGGLGGCPFAGGATGNLSTEDVLYLMDGLGVETGVDPDEVIDTAWWICDRLGRTPDSKVSKAKRSRGGRTEEGA